MRVRGTVIFKAAAGNASAYFAFASDFTAQVRISPRNVADNDEHLNMMVVILTSCTQEEEESEERVQSQGT